MEFSSLKIKKFLIFFQKQIPYISGESFQGPKKQKKYFFFSQKFIYLFLLIRIIHFSSEYSSSESMEFSSSEAISLATYLHVPKNT